MYRVMSILNTLTERGLSEQSYLDVSLLEVVTIPSLIRRVRNLHSNPENNGTEVAQKVCVTKMYSLNL